MEKLVWAKTHMGKLSFTHPRPAPWRCCSKPLTQFKQQHVWSKISTNTPCQSKIDLDSSRSRRRKRYTYLLLLFAIELRGLIVVATHMVSENVDGCTEFDLDGFLRGCAKWSLPFINKEWVENDVVDESAPLLLNSAAPPRQLSWRKWIPFI